MDTKLQKDWQFGRSVEIVAGAVSHVFAMQLLNSELSGKLVSQSNYNSEFFVVVVVLLCFLRLHCILDLLNTAD